MNRPWRVLKILFLVLSVAASLHWAGAFDRSNRVVADVVAPGGTRASILALPATPTAAPYPIGDMVLQGHVYKTGTPPGLLQPIVGANVSVLICQSPRLATTSVVDGFYSLYLPGAYLNPCESVIIDVWAEGYSRISMALPVSALRARPNRDFGLGEMAGTVSLPLVFR